MFLLHCRTARNSAPGTCVWSGVVRQTQPANQLEYYLDHVGERTRKKNTCPASLSQTASVRTLAPPPASFLPSPPEGAAWRSPVNVWWTTLSFPTIRGSARCGGSVGAGGVAGARRAARHWREQAMVPWWLWGVREGCVSGTGPTQGWRHGLGSSLVRLPRRGLIGRRAGLQWGSHPWQRLCSGRVLPAHHCCMG